MTTVALGYNPGQERDDHGRFGSGGSFLPKKDTHVSHAPPPVVKHDGNDPANQLDWAHTKAKEQGRPTYMIPNPAHVPGNPNTGGPYKLSYKPPTKGEYHEVKPDGSVTYHPPATKPIKAKGVHSRRIAFARAIETSSDGVAPSAARLWRAGWNKTDKGDLNFTPRSAELVMAAWEARGNPLVWYYEHEDRIALEKRGGAPMKGAASAPSSVLAIRPTDAGPECWAEQIQWTEEAKRQIASGERRQLSPIAAYDADTREIIEILNVSLCAEGATHHGTLLASRTGKGNMDELIDKIVSALESGDFEAAEDLVQEAEAQGGEMARMARCALNNAKKAKAAKPPPAAPPAADGGAEAKRALAAARQALGGIDLIAMLSREVAPLRATLEQEIEGARADRRESRRATVLTLIEANRDLFDTVDEREHLRKADPDATKSFVASLKRKGGAAVLVASRDIDPTTGKPKVDAKPPKDPPADKKPEDQLTVADKLAIDAYNRGKDPKLHITAAEFLANRERLNVAAGGSN